MPLLLTDSKLLFNPLRLRVFSNDSDDIRRNRGTSPRQGRKEAPPKRHLNESAHERRVDADLESSFRLRRKCFNVRFMVPRDNGWLIKKYFPLFLSHEE